MISTGQNVKRFLLITGDLVCFQIALLITVTIRHGSFDFDRWIVHAWPFFLVSLLWIICFFIVGLYDLAVNEEPLRLLRTYLEGMIANLGIALAFFYLIPVFGIAPRTILFLQFAVALLLGYFWRITISRWMLGTFTPGRVLYIGAAEDVQKVDALLKASTLGYRLAAAVPLSGETYRYGDVHWIVSLNDFEDMLKREGISAIVVGAKPEEHEGLKAALYRTLFTPVTILDRAELEEAATGRIPLSYVSETWFLRHLNEVDKRLYEGVKRLADIVVTLPIGIVTLLLIPFVAALTKLSSPGPLFIHQTRVGRGGKPFTLVKFRSMKVQSAGGLSEPNGPQFTTNAKTDPRLFPWGRLMRQLRIDELPQVWNVLKGDLSFIGPRPERPEFVAPLLDRMPYYALRHLSRPGLSGWAQVKFLTPNASIDDNLKKLQYDLYYIKHRSLLLDAVILLRTVGIVLRRQGT